MSSAIAPPSAQIGSGNSRQRRRDRMIATRLKDLMERSTDEKSLEHEEGDQWADTLAKTMLKGAAVKGQVALIKEVVLRVEGRVRDRADDESLRNLSDEELIAIVRKQRGPSGTAPATPAQRVIPATIATQSSDHPPSSSARDVNVERTSAAISESDRSGVEIPPTAVITAHSRLVTKVDREPLDSSSEDWLRKLSPYANCSWPRVAAVRTRQGPLTEHELAEMLIVPPRPEGEWNAKTQRASVGNERSGTLRERRKTSKEIDKTLRHARKKMASGNRAVASG
jgi:hypothetical protein